MAESTFVAVVEDDPEIRSLVAGLLMREGFAVGTCAGATELDRLLGRRRVDLVVLDLMLAGEDGLSICRRLQTADLPVPVLMVTARGDDIDRIVGLEMGADDYLPKPSIPANWWLGCGQSCGAPAWPIVRPPCPAGSIASLDGRSMPVRGNCRMLTVKASS